MLGCLAGGPLGDKVGRRPTVIFSACVIAPAVIGGAFAQSYVVYALLRFVTYVCTSVMWIAGE